MVTSGFIFAVEAFLVEINAYNLLFKIIKAVPPSLGDLSKLGEVE